MDGMNEWNDRGGEARDWVDGMGGKTERETALGGPPGDGMKLWAAEWHIGIVPDDCRHGVRCSGGSPIHRTTGLSLLIQLTATARCVSPYECVIGGREPAVGARGADAFPCRPKHPLPLHGTIRLQPSPASIGVAAARGSSCLHELTGVRAGCDSVSRPQKRWGETRLRISLGTVIASAAAAIVTTAIAMATAMAATPAAALRTTTSVAPQGSPSYPVGGGEEGDREVEGPVEDQGPPGGREVQPGGTGFPLLHGRGKAGAASGRG